MKILGSCYFHMIGKWPPTDTRRAKHEWAARTSLINKNFLKFKPKKISNSKYILCHEYKIENSTLSEACLLTSESVKFKVCVVFCQGPAKLGLSNYPYVYVQHGKIDVIQKLGVEFDRVA